MKNIENPESLFVFRGEGATVALAENHANLIKLMDITIEDSYNPFA